MKSENDSLSSDQSVKPRRPKARVVSSRFLSPTHDNGVSSSPSKGSSPLHHNSSPDTRKQRSHEHGGLTRGVWPSSSPSSQHSSNKQNLDTLADHLGNERLKDLIDRKKSEEKPSNKNSVLSLGRQRSATLFNRFENKKEQENTKENHKPTTLGGSMRYSGELRFPGKSLWSSSSSTSSSSTNGSSNNSGFVPGRLSVDENALYKNFKSTTASHRNSDAFVDNNDSESEFSEATDCTSPSIGKSSRKSSIEVSSKFLQDLRSRSRKWTTDSDVQNTVSLDSSPQMKKSTLRKAIKRVNSLAGYGSVRSQWALSPGRSGSPPISVESKERLMSFSSLKPPSSPSKPRGVEKLLNLGLGFLKGKKSTSSVSSPVGVGFGESFHQLRLLHNRHMQWRYANARADAVNSNITKQVGENLKCAWDSLAKLQHSVLLKKLQLQKEKLKMKLEFILYSQIKPLETWGDMERQHMSAVLKTKECLHSVVCRVPLIEGAKVDPESASVVLRQASDLAASMKSALRVFSSSAQLTAAIISELAEVIAHEKLLIEECIELLQAISLLEIEERSLKCFLLQFGMWQQQLQHRQQQHQHVKGAGR